MLSSNSQARDRFCKELSQRFDGQLRVIAKQAVTVWFNRERLDRLLAGYVSVLDGCELLYAIDQSGRQVSSNILTDAIDTDAYGQDLSDRPYSLSLSMLGNIESLGAFAGTAYTSRATQHDCVTVLYAVASGSTNLGYLAADFKHPGES